MRLFAITIMLLLAMVGTVQATMQEPEIITYQGIRRPLESLPFIGCEWPGGKHPAFRQDLSSLNRAYIAQWEIKNDKLYLVDIDAVIAVNAREYYENWEEYEKNGEFARVGVADLFPKDVKDGKVFASWYSGVLRIGVGSVVARHPIGGMGRFYSREVFLSIEKGIVRSTCIKEHTNDDAKAKLWELTEEGKPVLLLCP